MLIPSHLVPIKEITTDTIKFKAGPRVNHTYIGGGSHINTIEIKEDVDKKVLEEWLIFHSFVTNSRTPIEYYNMEGFPDKLEKLERPSQFGKDFNNFTSEIYYRSPKAAEAIKDKSYNSLFDRYLQLSRKNKDLIRNYLINLNKKEGRLDRQLFDRSYWQIVKHYSIIDKIIGQPPFCSNVLSCDTCGANGLKHHQVPARLWMIERLNQIMEQSSWTETFKDIIETAREKIRHASVHGAKLPNTSMPEHPKNGQVHYDLEKTLGTFETDTHALRALDGMLESVTWQLLMDHLFGHKAFGRPTGYSVGYITLNTKLKSDGSLDIKPSKNEVE